MLASRPALMQAASRKQCTTVCMATTPRHKATRHHRKSRPIKYNASDKRHGPPTYPAMPAPPPEVVVVSKKE
jgi:hypothetical protein